MKIMPKLPEIEIPKLSLKLGMALTASLMFFLAGVIYMNSFVYADIKIQVIFFMAALMISLLAIFCILVGLEVRRIVQENTVF